jgi:hypothetical protein
MSVLVPILNTEEDAMRPGNTTPPMSVGGVVASAGDETRAPVGGGGMGKAAASRF